VNKCTTCGKWVFEVDRNMHKCPPAYLVWVEQWHGPDDEGVRIFARTHESAAELWAEQDDRDSGEYSIVGGNPADVRVRLESDPSDEKWLRVEGESVPQYHASERPKPRIANKAENAP
jgi:hypothetical protein